MTEPPHVVIGAGPAGLAVMKEFNHSGIPFLGIEAEHTVGGLWNICSPQSPAYLNLSTNSSKTTTYLDQKAPASWPSYFTHELALQYLQDYATRNKLLSSIRFRTKVINLKAVEQGLWSITLLDVNTGQQEHLTARKVVLCTGVHNKTNRFVPPGLLTALKDSVIDAIHSSQYKDPAQYTDRRVLLLGFGNSAADIATEISAVAKSTILSSRSVPWIIPLWILGMPADQFRSYATLMRVPFCIQNFVFHCLQRLYIGHPRKLGLGKARHDLLDRLPLSDRGLIKAIEQKRVCLRGPVQRINNNCIHFAGESETSEQVDKVIFATGYTRDYPFLHRKYKQPLLHEELPFPLLIFHPDHKNLFFTSEVNVPQGSWPLFTKQAQAIVAYLKAEQSPGDNFYRFNKARHETNPDLKGKLFRCADRYHVDPDLYARSIDRFCAWIRS